MARKPRVILEEAKPLEGGTARHPALRRDRWRPLRTARRCAACVLLSMSPRNRQHEQASPLSSHWYHHQQQQQQQYRQQQPPYQFRGTCASESCNRCGDGSRVCSNNENNWIDDGGGGSSDRNWSSMNSDRAGGGDYNYSSGNSTRRYSRRRCPYCTENHGYTQSYNYHHSGERASQAMPPTPPLASSVDASRQVFVIQESGAYHEGSGSSAFAARPPQPPFEPASHESSANSSSGRDAPIGPPPPYTRFASASARADQSSPMSIPANRRLSVLPEASNDSAANDDSTSRSNHRRRHRLSDAAAAAAAASVVTELATAAADSPLSNISSSSHHRRTTTTTTSRRSVGATTTPTVTMEEHRRCFDCEAHARRRRSAAAGVAPNAGTAAADAASVIDNARDGDASASRGAGRRQCCGAVPAAAAAAAAAATPAPSASLLAEAAVVVALDEERSSQLAVSGRSVRTPPPDYCQHTFASNFGNNSNSSSRSRCTFSCSEIVAGVNTDDGNRVTNSRNIFTGRSSEHRQPGRSNNHLPVQSATTITAAAAAAVTGSYGDSSSNNNNSSSSSSSNNNNCRRDNNVTVCAVVSNGIVPSRTSQAGATTATRPAEVILSTEAEGATLNCAATFNASRADEDNAPDRHQYRGRDIGSPVNVRDYVGGVRGSSKKSHAERNDIVQVADSPSQVTGVAESGAGIASRISQEEEEPVARGAFVSVTVTGRIAENPSDSLLQPRISLCPELSTSPSVLLSCGSLSSSWSASTTASSSGSSLALQCGQDTCARDGDACCGENLGNRVIIINANSHRQILSGDRVLSASDYSLNEDDDNNNSNRNNDNNSVSGGNRSISPPVADNAALTSPDSLALPTAAGGSSAAAHRSAVRADVSAFQQQQQQQQRGRCSPLHSAVLRCRQHCEKLELISEGWRDHPSACAIPAPPDETAPAATTTTTTTKAVTTTSSSSGVSLTGEEIVAEEFLSDSSILDHNQRQSVSLYNSTNSNSSNNSSRHGKLEVVARRSSPLDLCAGVGSEVNIEHSQYSEHHRGVPPRRSRSPVIVDAADDSRTESDASVRVTTLCSSPSDSVVVSVINEDEEDRWTRTSSNEASVDTRGVAVTPVTEVGLAVSSGRQTAAAAVAGGAGAGGAGGGGGGGGGGSGRDSSEKRTSPTAPCVADSGRPARAVPSDGAAGLAAVASVGQPTTAPSVGIPPGASPKGGGGDNSGGGGGQNGNISSSSSTLLGPRRPARSGGRRALLSLSLGGGERASSGGGQRQQQQQRQRSSESDDEEGGFVCVREVREVLSAPAHHLHHYQQQQQHNHRSGGDVRLSLQDIDDLRATDIHQHHLYRRENREEGSGDDIGNNDDDNAFFEQPDVVLASSNRQLTGGSPELGGFYEHHHPDTHLSSHEQSRPTVQPPPPTPASHSQRAARERHATERTAAVPVMARFNASWSSVNRQCRRQHRRTTRREAQRLPSDAQGCLEGALPPYSSSRHRAAGAAATAPGQGCPAAGPPCAPCPYPPGVGGVVATPAGLACTRAGRYVEAVEIETPKHCCALLVNQTISIRWFILMIAFVGLCCSLVGTVLGTFRMGREHLTISLLMIGVGIVLITVSGVAWRLTSHDSAVSSCGTMLGLTTDPHAEPNRRFVPRIPPYGRYSHPYAAMMYPEFHYRPPPPSYQASMQEYRLRLLFDRHPPNSQGAAGMNTTPSGGLSATSNDRVAANSACIAGGSGPPLNPCPISPPPTYRSAFSSTLDRSHSRPQLCHLLGDDSRPPSYRSRASSHTGGGGPVGSVLRSCLGDAARSCDSLATTPPSEAVPNPVSSCLEIEKAPVLRSSNDSTSLGLTLDTRSGDATTPCGNVAGTDNGSKQSSTTPSVGTGQRGSDVVKVYVNFAAE